MLAPLKELESAATAGISNFESEESGLEKIDQSANVHHGCLPHASKILGASRNSISSNRSSLEDMELETRALTEPLPTNQQV